MTNARSCRAPDWTTRVMYKCPCGDQPVMIAPERQSETYEKGAYWCSTVMALLDFDGSPKYVWNPFSLKQLKEKLDSSETGTFEEYLECVASKNDNTCQAPTDSIFERQQIPMLSVYQRCLSNYQALTWDQGTFVMFNASLQRDLRLDHVMPVQIDDTFEVAQCLLETKADGGDNAGCLRDRFLKGTQAVDYFKYSNITSTDSPPSKLIDACLTFSGPSASPDPNTARVFLSCLEHNANSTGCDIPHMLWSGRSTNKVPVATQHTMDISDMDTRRRLAQDEIDVMQANVLAVLDKLSKTWDGSGLKVTLFSSEGDLLHQYADCVMQGPLGRMVLTPGPDGVEKVVWSRNSKGLSDRTFEIPCSGERLTNRDGLRDDAPPFTCGTYARRSVLKYFLRKVYGEGMKDNQGAKDAVVKAVQGLINTTREAWSFSKNFLCTCRNGTTTGWECCTEQSNCATDPCPCPEGFDVAASVACCKSVCPGLAGAGIMQPFSYINGSKLAADLLAGLGAFLQNDVWISNAPWLEFDPMGADAYQASWNASEFDVADAGLFDASKPVAYYDEIKYPFQSTFWEHCTGLLQQVIWTMPMDRRTGRPKGVKEPYDPINGQPVAPNVTYTEEFIQSLTLEAYRSSPIYWHYNVRHAPSQSEVCRRTVPRPTASASFSVGKTSRAAQLGFSSLTLGGLGGADCYCGWWDTPATCRIPASLCATMVQILGFTRICVSQRQVYNASDHAEVLRAIQTLLIQQPSTTYPCPSLQVSEHWGFIDPSNGLPWANVNDLLLREGASGFRAGNADWLIAAQGDIVHPGARIEPSETPTANVALQCSAGDPALADHFVDELFPSAQGVRQSMPQSYCTRYGIELARLTVYTAAGLGDAVGQQKSVADKWKMRCQYKLEELAVCNSFRVYNATGGPTSTEQCPFTLSVVSSLKASYAVTPGCLVVLWNTPNARQDGIYDPCICVSCTGTPNIDVPAQLTTTCRMEAFQALVGKDVIPGESAEVPLGSGSFRLLMDKPGFLQINTPDITHWALHTGIRDADLISDWWPDEWRYPAGYHVTPGCSRPGDAHWKTFDASWRWDSQKEAMVFAKDETNDAFLSRNAFGASGVCRANNYGMPMTGLNTMAVCTRENANAAADPMVPKRGGDQPWADGPENCAPDAFSTPWKVDRAINPPRQWSVGTLQNDVLAPLPATEWGAACGPYPLTTCVGDSECATGLKCILTANGAGVCGKVQAAKFECTNHAQCDSDMLCAGDGVCVQGVWQIKNELQAEAVSFRTYSQNCPTGTPLDTWGTSIAETVPDILSASGLCSYRSWFENRRMAARNACDKSDTCRAVSGLQPWNFSSPRMRNSAGSSAFDSEVLKVRAHPCDRDYQYLQNFVSCTPNDAYLRMFDSFGNPVASNTSVPKDNRTQTYRTNKQLPVIHHVDEIVGPTFGFTGVPLTYTQLNLGSTDPLKPPSIIPCASLKVCSLQPASSFKVNNLPVDARRVLDGDTERGYTIEDMLSCGVFGVLKSPERITCMLDFAVVPLAKLLIAGVISNVGFPSFASSEYPKDKKADMLAKLQQLPDLVLSRHIGGPPTSLKDYMAKTSKFVALYSAIGQIAKPNYTDAGVPNQIYNTTLFGAMEVPFVWWYKCAWLNQLRMGVDVIEQSLCQWDAPNEPQGTGFGPLDARLNRLFQLASPSAQAAQTVPGLQQVLTQLPGVVTQAIYDQAYADFASSRAQMAQLIKALLSPIQRRCFQYKAFVDAFSRQSSEYQLARLNQFNLGTPFDSTAQYANDNTQAPLCTGKSCYQSGGYGIPTDSNADLSALVHEALTQLAIANASIALDSPVLNIPERVTLSSPFVSESVADSLWSALLARFDNRPDSCTEIVTSANTKAADRQCLCQSDWRDCGAKILGFMLSAGNVPLEQPSPETNAVLELNRVSKTVCGDLRLSTDGTCFLDSGAIDLGEPLPNVNFVKAPVGVSVETYTQEPWPCVQLSCGSADPTNDGKWMPSGYSSWSMSTRERITLDIYEYDQPVATTKYNPWPDLETQNRDLICSAGGQSRFERKQVRVSLSAYAVTYPYKCVDVCPVEKRVVARGPIVRLRTINITYYVNETLMGQLEYYPCIKDPSNLDRVRGSIYHSPYQNERRVSDFPDCAAVFNSANDMPNAGYLDTRNVRKIMSSISPATDLDTVTVAIKRVVAKLSTDADADCLASSSNCNTLSGSVSKIAWNTADGKRAFYCGNLKSDPYFGCLMYPAEMVEVLNTKDTVTEVEICQDYYDGRIDYNNMVYHKCRANSDQDECTSRFLDPIFGNPYRDMKLTGLTLVFKLQTVNPACTLGPLRQCLLENELPKLSGKNSTACYGPDNRGQRFQEYNKLNQYQATRLSTKILQPAVFSGETPQLSTGSNLFFHHLYVGLNPGYYCGDSAPKCPASGIAQVGVQVRKRLWKCLNCPMVSPLQCRGNHDCMLTTPRLDAEALQALDGWALLSAGQRAFLTATDSPSDVAVPALRWLVGHITKLWTPDVRLSYEVPDFMRAIREFEYNPLPVMRFDAAMQLSFQSCDKEGSRPDFTNCSYDSRRRNLRDFVARNYKVEDGAVIRPQQTLQWRVKRTQMITQNIPQWELSVPNNRSGMFMADLLSDKWCRNGSVTDNACYARTDSKGNILIDVLNPSLLGAFEPSAGCDTAVVNQQRVISAGCWDCADPKEYVLIEDGATMPCDATMDAVRRVTVDETSASNLCNKAPAAASKCTNLHGMLGQYDGQPAGDVYARQPWGGGLPAGVSLNPLFWNKPPASGVSNLVIRPEDIGGHFIRMVVARQTRSGAYSMSIQGLPLSSYADPLSPSAYALGVAGGDKSWTQINAAVETDRLRTLYPASVCAAWDCPLRRRAFYMGLDPGFRPRVPDPLRTKVLFGSRAHPTQAAFPMPSVISQTASSVLGAYSTSNGFCSCMSPPCTLCALDTASLTGEWTFSSVLGTSCSEQLDWPYAGGKLRDGAELTQRWSTLTPCGILDRLPRFQYRYKNTQTTQPSTKTTLDKGGVCHMGWPVVTAGPLAGCYLLSDQEDTFMCPNFLQPKPVVRLRAKTVPELLRSSARPRLADCNPPPTYQFANGSTSASEVSYGQLKRHEASRMLANDLRRRLCGNSTVCKPASQWSLPSFWTSVFMANFPPIPQGNGENPEAWTGRPWLACTQAENGTQSCQGRIPRRDWATGSRPNVCLDSIMNQSNADDLTQRINICDMDPEMDRFCRTIQDARYRVFEANCLYSGQCRQKLFFYQPSTYEVDNNEFVRSTVQTFYNSTVAGACIPDQDTAAQIEINKQSLEKCSAMKLNFLANAIQTVRTIAGLLVEIMYYVGQMGLYLFQMLTAPGPDEREQISAEITAMLKLLQNKFMMLFQEMGDLFYSIVFDGPLGDWLIGIIQKICEFIQWLFSKVVYVVLCFVHYSALLVLESYGRGVVKILDGISFGQLGYLNGAIDNAVTSVKTSIPCSDKKLWDCNLHSIKKNKTSSTLPLPTRCWAGVEPGVSSLACTAADTCMQQSDYSKVICGACPVASSMTRFGCDSLTKLCTCNVFPVGISSCASHEECTMQDKDVNCRYVDSYLQPSYGNVPCTQCPKPMCLIADGSGVGQCSCLLRPVPLQTCSGVGQRVSPDATKLCLVAPSGGGQLASSNAYTATYRTMMSAPCMLLNQGATFCYSVYTSGTVSTELVLGMSILTTGRRRLLWEEGSVALQSNASEWEAQSEPCRSLVLANASELGILERYARGECWRWHDVGMRLVIEANMSHAVSPFFLVSWKDLLAALLNNGALIEIMAKLPRILHGLLLHSEFAQPVYLMMAYWASVLPEDVWTNQTFLDHANEYFRNISSRPAGRRLLTTLLPQDVPRLQPDRRLLQNTVIDTAVSSETVYEWSQGPYSWPPNYMYWKGDGSCAVVSTAINVVKNGLDATIQYYKHPVPEPLPLSWPPLPFRLKTASLPASAIDVSSIESFADSTKEVLSNLTDVWLDEEAVRSFLMDAPYMTIIKRLIQCNFTRIQTCEDRKSLFWSLVQTLLFVVVLTVLIRSLQIPYAETVIFIGAVPIFLYITYGYSPTCAPLIPTCLLKDTLDLLEWLLPESIAWPDGLTTEPGCTSAACLRSCTKDPVVGFANYNDHIAWIMCEANPDQAISSAIGMAVDSPIRLAIMRKCVDAGMRTAHRICFAITLVNSVPLLVIAVLALWALPSVLAFAVAMVQFVLSTAFAFIIFVHSRDD